MSQRNICVSRSSGLKEHDYKYLTRRTGLSRDDIKNIYDQFIAGNEDKKLDKNEFSALYLKLDPKGHKHMEKVIDFVYAAFDRNNNGSINFREFLFAYAMTNDDDLKDKLGFAFEVFDLNNNGTLSEEEIDSVLNAMTTVNVI
jgi:Ca2+-binding EF-hand superfamily protein